MESSPSPSETEPSQLQSRKLALPDGGTVSYAERRRGVRVSLDGRANDGAPRERDNARAERVEGGSGNDVLTREARDALRSRGRLRVRVAVQARAPGGLHSLTSA